ncbi:hypothetical protein J587_2091 [Acinetobacter baumannii 144107]|nr:hypothetical protein J587_2091 [Acinetobacter baumannii 144107]
MELTQNNLQAHIFLFLYENYKLVCFYSNKKAHLPMSFLFN